MQKKLFVKENKKKENQEKRYEEIRNTNIRIHELERQMADMKPIDGLKEQLSGLTRKIDGWWDELVFNYISEMSFSKWGGLDIKFGFQLGRVSILLSSTPVWIRKKMWIKYNSFAIKDLFSQRKIEKRVLLTIIQTRNYWYNF
ncbi:hypothetical protein ACQUW6_24520 [Bacillus thuringiensis]|uniref:hypothetical protein n=1 Tax=Bacillus thuringiensis TaxID=1428 RepID=UPI003D10F74A